MYDFFPSVLLNFFLFQNVFLEDFISQVYVYLCVFHFFFFLGSHGRRKFHFNVWGVLREITLLLSLVSFFPQFFFCINSMIYSFVFEVSVGIFAEIGPERFDLRILDADLTIS